MIVYYILFNTLGFLVIALDKYKAIHHQYRISEKVLLLNIVLGGCFGSALSMFLFHHKTKKLKFKCILILSFSIHTLLYICSLIY